MKKVLLVAASALFVSACDGGGCVTKQEAAQAFQQRDRAIQILAQEISILQGKNKVATATPTVTGGKKRK